MRRALLLFALLLAFFCERRDSDLQTPLAPTLEVFSFFRLFFLLSFSKQAFFFPPRSLFVRSNRRERKEPVCDWR